MIVWLMFVIKYFVVSQTYVKPSLSNNIFLTINVPIFIVIQLSPVDIGNKSGWKRN